MKIPPCPCGATLTWTDVVWGCCADDPFYENEYDCECDMAIDCPTCGAKLIWPCDAHVDYYGDGRVVITDE